MAIAGVALAVVFFIVPLLQVGRGAIFMFILLAWSGLLLWRTFLLWAWGTLGAFGDRVLILGTGVSAQKVARDKPTGLTDRCYDGSGDKVSDDICGDPVVPIYGTPRTVAGDAITTDTNKCQLKPLNRSDDYGPIPLADDQWAALQQVFPGGVCDYSKPGVDQQGTIAWQTYQDAKGKVHMAYNDFTWVAHRHGINDRDAQFKMATMVIESITSAAK